VSSIAQRILEAKRAKQQQQVEGVSNVAEEEQSPVSTPTTIVEKGPEEIKANGGAAESAPTTVPSNLRDLLGTYNTLAAVTESPVWKLLSLPQRVLVRRLYTESKQLGASANDNAGGEFVSAREVESSVKTGEHIRADHELSFIQRIFKEYPDPVALVESADFKSWDAQKKADVLREYTKRAQISAQILNQHQRMLERLRTKEEAEKVLAAGGSLAAKDVSTKHEAFSLSVKLNDKQDLAVVYALEGKSFVLTGAAGTGKTTACREIAKAFLERGNLGTHYFKVQDDEGRNAKIGAPGIAFVSYTRRASANIRRALHKDPTLEQKLEHNIVTMHRLLEYEPEFYVTPEGKDSMRFVPKRNAHNQLDCKVVVIEEASMLGLDLWERFFEAVRPGTIIVFVGDINQLPPVFGKSIMNYALAQLPVVELTEVYRQALDSGVIVNAHKILKGQAPEANKDTQLVTGNQPTHVGQERMAKSLGKLFFQLWEQKEFDPEQDIILSPWNKQPCGTDNMNNWIAQLLGEKRNAMVYEVLAGRRKMYLAVGDRVMYEKRDGIIKAIRHNAQYLGKAPQPASTSLTRFGLRKLEDQGDTEDFELSTVGYENINIDEVPDEEKKLQASHVVELTLDDGSLEVLSAVGDFADQVFSLGYCLTVHKAQGCEWRKVFVILHKDHTLGGFLTRELVYTAATRAREKLILIAKPDTLAKAVKQQTIKGDTLEEKIQSINSGAANIGTYPVIKRR
jgi:ATP-dependent exoDNAse (exonuclease V) alpha subunit